MTEVYAVKTDKQRVQIEAHLLDQGQIYSDIWKVGINVALRISDLLRVTMDDIRGLDRDRPVLTVQERKTDKIRKIAINRAALEVMERRLADNPKHEFLFQSESPRLRRKSKPINKRSVLRVFERTGNNIRPKVKMGTHSMRKTRGYALHKAGFSVEKICKILGHSSTSVTMRYIGIDQDTVDNSFIEYEL